MTWVLVATEWHIATKQYPASADTRCGNKYVRVTRERAPADVNATAQEPVCLECCSLAVADELHGAK